MLNDNFTITNVEPNSTLLISNETQSCNLNVDKALLWKNDLRLDKATTCCNSFLLQSRLATSCNYHIKSIG